MDPIGMAVMGVALFLVLAAVLIPRIQETVQQRRNPGANNPRPSATSDD